MSKGEKRTVEQKRKYTQFVCMDILENRHMLMIHRFKYESKGKKEETRVPTHKVLAGSSVQGHPPNKDSHLSLESLSKGGQTEKGSPVEKQSPPFSASLRELSGQDGQPPYMQSSLTFFSMPVWEELISKAQEKKLCIQSDLRISFLKDCWEEYSF